MSTNQTKNYGLFAWEAEDDFLRAEINENFGKLDEAVGALAAAVMSKAEFVFGTYTGNGSDNLHVELGRQPKAVYLCRSNGAGGDNTYIRMGLFGPETPLNSGTAAVDETGFTLGSGAINSRNTLYHFIAFF